MGIEFFILPLFIFSILIAITLPLFIIKNSKHCQKFYVINLFIFLIYAAIIKFLHINSNSDFKEIGTAIYSFVAISIHCFFVFLSLILYKIANKEDKTKV